MKKLPVEAMAPKMASKPKKLETYELDNHVNTLVNAHDIYQDKNLKKQVLHHAKNKKNILHKVSKMMMDSPEEEMSESSDSPSEERKEIKSIDDIRSRKKKIKSKMFGGM
jgi:hypothetical protein